MNAAESIRLYSSLFYVCLAVAIAGLLLAVILFFVLDIRSVFSLMTGRAKRKGTQRDVKRERAGRKYSARRSGKQSRRQQMPAANPAAPIEAAAEQPDQTQDKQTELLQTELLETEQPPAAQPFGSTDRTDLDADSEKTVPLSYAELGNLKPSGRFEITESEIFVTTNEIIPCWGFPKTR